MRYGVLADIHGNLHALERVLDLFGQIGVDGYLVAGDLVGYCAFPNECVERVQELDPVCVAGNHDLISLGQLGDDRCIELARQTLRWTADVLTDDAREYLAGLPLCVDLEGIALAHGSLEDPQKYVVRREQAVEQLRRAEERSGARILILGHTHRAWACDAGGSTRSVRRELDVGGGRFLLNPGAVGQSRELRARARCMILDLERRRASFHAIGYDVAACREALRRHGLPVTAYRLRPSPRRAFSRAVRRAKRALS